MLFQTCIMFFYCVEHNILSKYLLFFPLQKKILHIEKGKPVEKLGRKTTGLRGDSTYDSGDAIGIRSVTSGDGSR